MKKEICLLVVCSNDEVQKLKNEFARNTEIKIKYSADSYFQALKIINDKDSKIDAIIVDGMMEESNILKFLTEYKNKYLLSKTIIIDNIKLDCYNLIGSYQVFNIIPKSYRIEELITCLEQIYDKSKIYDQHKIGAYDKISLMLKKLGIAPDKNGFHYLRKAIYECC